MTEQEARDEELRIMSLPKMQEKFREAMGEWQNGDRGHDPIYKRYGMFWRGTLYLEYGIGVSNIDAHCVALLPLPIDPVNPERGLLGMFDTLPGLRFSPYLENETGAWAVDMYDSRFYKTETRYGKTPALALLKALAYQWEIEVEK